MKYFLKVILPSVIAIVITGYVVSYFYFSSAVKSAIEVEGYRILGHKIEVGNVSVNPISGNCEITNLRMNNSPNFSDKFLFNAKKITFKLKPSSFFSNSVLIDTVKIEALHINYEQKKDINTKLYLNSLKELDKKIDDVKYKRIEINKFRIKLIKIHVKSDQLKEKLALSEENFELNNLGDIDSPDTMFRHVNMQIFELVNKRSALELTQKKGKLKSGVGRTVKGIRKGASKIVDGIRTIFKKKKPKEDIEKVEETPE
ncbi:MAG: hypothetical protein HRT89_11350 [Lentisphaeria bacterium]|nr:hypothetical protein [Lentisphaeria bacterium]NQZ68651.1 hypothetical protein [Lentisphaeria bacterium]